VQLQEKPRTLRIAGLRGEIRNRDFPKTKVKDMKMIMIMDTVKTLMREHRKHMDDNYDDNGDTEGSDDEIQNICT
jgi:hypothetical protein